MNNNTECPLTDIGYEKFENAIDMISGKWKLRIIFYLALNQKLRYNELKKLIPKISHKMLSSQLKELENYNLVERKEYPQIPPKVEYSLTNKGRTLQPVVVELSKWIEQYNDNLIIGEKS